MKHFLFAITLFINIISCNQEDPNRTKLDKIHEVIVSDPVRALQMLDSIDFKHLTSSKLRARYSLLYSVALDRNYIDISNDSIIAPALKYYSRHGSLNEQCAVHYYTARIYENAGELEKSMLSLAKMSKIDTSKVQAGILRRIYFLKGRIYESIWRREESIEAYETAIRYAHKDHDLDNYKNWIGKSGAVRVVTDDEVTDSSSDYRYALRVSHCLNGTQRDKLPTWKEAPKEIYSSHKKTVCESPDDLPF